MLFFFFQAEDGIRDFHVTGVQTCALPICRQPTSAPLCIRPAGILPYPLPGNGVRLGPIMEAQATTRRRVVVADDDVLLREGVASVLERSGFQVVGQAGDADELV